MGEINSHLQNGFGSYTLDVFHRADFPSCSSLEGRNRGVESMEGGSSHTDRPSLLFPPVFFLCLLTSPPSVLPHRQGQAQC